MFIGTQNVRTCALMFIVLAYLMFGAAVFNACKYLIFIYRINSSIILLFVFLLLLLLVESKEEVRLRAALRQKIARILYKNDTIPNETVFISLTSAIFENRHFRSGTTRQWTFPGAFYFSTLVVTLIGKFSIKKNKFIQISSLYI